MSNYAIKCGRCKGTHKTVDQVKACYGTDAKLTTVAKPAEPVEQGITAKQEAFLNKLLDERPMFRDVENLWPDNIAKLTKAEASIKIEEVLSVDKEVTTTGGKPNLTSILENVQDGYYALPCKTGNNDFDFVRVGSNQGKFNPADKGKRRVQRYLGGQGPIQIQYAEAIAFANIIAALSVEEQDFSRKLFGREVGHCGCCGKSLTDQVSRAMGIGPECAKKGGF